MHILDCIFVCPFATRCFCHFVKLFLYPFVNQLKKNKVLLKTSSVAKNKYNLTTLDNFFGL